MKDETIKPAGRKEIMKRIEKLQTGELLRFQLSPTYGGQIVILELNPSYPGNREKKYLLRLGDTEERALEGEAFYSSDKAKNLAVWVAERSARWLDNEKSKLEAA